ncbi:PREDICTED: cytoskeleton-associated protein 2-like [Nanorana parkeri]|uniref:cytoskeleton-associated protein 2-like n=1 Tax=Nanorana parkeri TaxID=125878 RepID=UPI0008545612|nr:PREDICTED: cytoskeleton-associated protein 2-like [Nanorana parkeri]
MSKRNKKSKVVTFGPLPNEDSDQDDEKDVHVHGTPCSEMGVCDQGSAVKFQVTSITSKKKKDGSRQEWKCLTPVRRSLRIHQSAGQYPQVVKEHDIVMASLEGVMDMSDTEAYLYVRNEALPEEADHPILSMVKQDSSEGEV